MAVNRVHGMGRKVPGMAPIVRTGDVPRGMSRATRGQMGKRVGGRLGKKVSGMSTKM